MGKQRELNEKEKKSKRIALIFGFSCGFLILLHFIIISLIFTWSDWIDILIFSLLLIAPAYLTNGGMAIMGGGKPIDGGKNWRDGKRIFGDHKTWNGFIRGPLLFSTPISIGIFILFLSLWQFIGPAFQFAINDGAYKIYTNISFYEYYFIGGSFPLGLLALTIRIILCSFGAAIGDLLGSFLKRRLNIESGQPFWIRDQLDFIIVSILLIAIPGMIFPNSLFWTPDWHIIIFLLILTPSVSVLGNNVAYYAGIKDVPW